MKHLALAVSLSISWLALTSPALRAEYPHVIGQGNSSTLVFVADGSGDQHYLSDALRALACENHLPLCIQRVAWSRLAVGALDLHDITAQKAAADQLVARVLTVRSCQPQTRICLVGHSAGTHVVLEAARQLPEGSIHRIILLASAVSRHYDLRGALAASCMGIDSFFSKLDLTLLAVETVCLTADGHKALTGGRVGFIPACASDALTLKLRQHSYTSSLKEVGHLGGHYGWTRATFLGNFVIPLLTAE